MGVERRAEETLSRYLTAAQRRSREEHGYFDLTGSRGNRYRIFTQGWISGNVVWMVAGEQQGCFCAHPRGGLPYADNYLGQFLALVTDEDDFLDHANLFGGRFPPTFGDSEMGYRRNPMLCPCTPCQRERERIVAERRRIAGRWP